MSAAAPWSVKGIDPKAREVAKDLARRSGMTLGEWLNTMIMDDEDDGVQPLPLGRRPHASETIDRRGRSRRLDDAYERPAYDMGTSADETLLRVAASVETIAARLEAAERRSTVAIQGVDQAVAGLVRRLDGQETVGKTYGRRIDDISEELREGHRRLRRFEQETGPSTAESFGKVEQGVNALASRLYDIEERQRTGVNELRQRLDTVEKIDVSGRLDTALTALTSRLYDIEERQRVGVDTLRQRMEMVEKSAGPGAGTEMLAQVGARLDTAQAATTEALKGLERSFAGLDQRLRATEGRVEPEGVREAARFEKLAETLSRQVEANRTEMMRRLDTAEAEGRMERIERAVVSIGDQAKASEQRSAQGIEAMGREVLRIAQNLNGRMGQVETGGAAALEKLGQTLATTLTEKLDRDMGRYAQAVDQRLNRTDDQHAMALEKLGGEITRISDRLADRIAQSERKSAQALEDIGRRLSDSSDRIEQRYDRASGELGERMRLSEERTARLLSEARDAMEQRVERAARDIPLESPRHRPDLQDDLHQPDLPSADWRAAAFPGEDFDAAPDDIWSTDALRSEPAPAPFPGHFGEAPASEPRVAPALPPQSAAAVAAMAVPAPRLTQDVVDGARFEAADAFAEAAAPTPQTVAPHAAEPFGAPAPFGAFGGADVSDVLEATAEADFGPAFEPRTTFAQPAPASAPAEAFDAGQDEFAAETEFVDTRAMRQGLAAGAAGRTTSTRSAIDAARAAMTTPAAAEEPRGAFGLNIKRGGKSRLQERLDKQAAKDGSTIRKALLASVTSMAVIGGVYATGRLTGGVGFAVPGLDSLSQALGLGAPAGIAPPAGSSDDLALAAVALTPTDAVAMPTPEAEGLYDRAIEQLDAGEAGGVDTLTRAANLGHTGAQLKLAGLYQTGENGVTRNAGESRVWARRAAEGGDPAGMHAFGMYLFDGVGGARNRPEALNWLLKAADRGLVDSQYNAARIYENGDEGIAPNPTEAFKWYLIAARTGDQQAQSAVDRLTPLVPAAGRATARASAEAFQVEPLA